MLKREMKMLPKPKPVDVTKLAKGKARVEAQDGGPSLPGNDTSR